ncbi:MAG: glycoside hydrolase family 2 TIM barrel-domain containing protein [Planctomycetota bacterium]
MSIVSYVRDSVRSLTACLLATAFAVPASAQDFAAAPVPKAIGGLSETTASLDGKWSFRTGPDSDAQAGSIRVPGQWVQQGYTVREGDAAEFRRTFEVPASWDDFGVRVRFEAVFSEATIEINGNVVGEHAGPFTAFEFDVTDHVQPGQNEIVVRVKGEGTETDLLGTLSQYAAHDLGGISRSITLYAVPRSGRLQSLSHATDVEPDHSKAVLTVSTQFAEDAAKPVSATALLIDASGDAVARSTANADNAGAASFEFAVTEPQLWSHETPNLYTLRIDSTAGDVTTTYEQRIGLREVAVVGRELHVNHRPVTLRGINRHVIHPYDGRVVSPELARRDAELLRDANINLVRTSHYPPSLAFVEACDELGIMVEVEAPFCWVGKYDGARKNWKEERWDPNNRERWLPTFERLNLAMVSYFQMNPSIVIWSLANESLWTPLWADVHQSVLAYDATRATIFHDPPGVGIDNDPARPKLQNLHYPGPGFATEAQQSPRPVFLGEFCHLNSYNRRELLSDPGVRDRWGTGFQVNWQRVVDAEGVIGGAIWSGIDDEFYLPNDLLVGYGGWGPVDAFRRKKPEHWHVKKSYSPLRLREVSPAVYLIENRHSFLDLIDIEITWQHGATTGTVDVRAAPGGAATFELPVGIDLTAAPLDITCVDPRGVEIDRYRIGGPSEATQRPIGEPEVVSLTLEDGMYRIRRGQLELGVNASNGYFDGIRSDGRPVLGAGISLMITPLNGEGGIQLTGDNQVIEPFNPIATGWTDPDIRIESRDDGGLVAHIGGTLKQARGAFRIAVPPAGPIEVSYDFEILEAVNPREWGVQLAAAEGASTVQWTRRGLWSLYPSTHIGRTEGTARLNGLSVDRGSWPSHPWALDDSPLGSNDFRASKHNFFEVSLTDDKGHGMRALSDGDDTSRSWMEGGTVRWLVAGYSNAGNEPFFRSHAAAEDRPLAVGDRIRGSFHLEPIHP